MSKREYNIHRKELLRFLLVGTAAVRAGIKPAELLRIPRCYRKCLPDLYEICIHQQEVFLLLKLDYYVLRSEGGDKLVLFYHRQALERTLDEPENRDYLAGLGYSPAGLPERLGQLRTAFSRNLIPHEVGVFVGYPLKDVLGFIERRAETRLVRGTWRVYGDPAESVKRMTVYRAAALFAERVIDGLDTLEECIEKLNGIDIGNIRRFANV